jgi:hypothetical protein
LLLVFHKMQLWINCGKLLSVFKIVENLELFLFIHFPFKGKAKAATGLSVFINRIHGFFALLLWGKFYVTFHGFPLLFGFVDMAIYARMSACVLIIVLVVVAPYNSHRYR